MDRNVITATILMALVFFLWLYLLPKPQPAVEEVPPPDSAVTTVEPEAPQQVARPVPIQDSTVVLTGEERAISVVTRLFEAELSTKGATLTRFSLREFRQFDQQTPVQLVGDTPALALRFQSPTGRNRDTRDFFYEADVEANRLDVLDGPQSIMFTVPAGQGLIRKTYTFSPDSYEVGLKVEMIAASSFQTADGYELVWDGALPFSEDPNNRKEELTKAGAWARSGGEVEGVSLGNREEDAATLRGDVSWISVKNKYFTVAAIPSAPALEAYLEGTRTGEADDPALRLGLSAGLFMGSPRVGGDSFRLYLGPLDYRYIKQYDGLYGMVDYGWDAFEWMTRPLARVIFIPVFTFLSSFIASYGLVIIVFCMLIKVALFPITRVSYKSMAGMRELAPKMQEIKEKYKDNPQKQQQATMKLYKETGMNPLSSCLPMLLQYPIIIALWQFLQQSIEIRQQSFLWALDLSAPDAILQLPFTVPFYGDYVAGFTVLMGISLIIQMRIQSTPASGMQQRIMMYGMPLFIFVIFNRLPSGLSLYYLCYNIFTAAQQQVINIGLKKKKQEEPRKGVIRSAPQRTKGSRKRKR